MNYVIIFLLAIITSTLSAVVGLGGGLLLIPFLVLILGLHLKYVAGTMLFAMIFYTLIASIRNFRNRYINLKLGFIMEIGSIAGVIAGAHLSAEIPNFLLKVFFVLIAFYLMIALKIPTYSSYNYIARIFKVLNIIPPHIRSSTSPKSKLSIPALIFLGVIAGLFSGMLGIGGGFLKTPVLIVGVLLPPKIAVGTSLFMIFVTALFGTINHAILGHINYTIALTVTGGVIIGAVVGTSILKKLPEERIKKYIFLTMLIAGILTFFR